MKIIRLLIYFLYLNCGFSINIALSQLNYERKYFDVDFPIPKQYIARKVNNGLIKIDGNIDEKEWEGLQWTEEFVDIEGDKKVKPRFVTRVKMCYDENNLYVAAFMQEPHLTATLTEKNSVIYKDNDFEVFIDPSGSSHEYTEFEMNVFNTIWGLLICNPYRDGYNIINPYPIAGLQSAVKLYGTINDPSDVDEGWTVEIAFPWLAIRQFADRNRNGIWFENLSPKEGDFWRINFSRVEWQYDIIDRKYIKKNLPEDNWVWSPQWEIAMHKPETYGFLHFSKANGSIANERWELQKVLFWIYQQQSKYYSTHKKYANSYYSLNIDICSLYSAKVKPILMKGIRFNVLIEDHTYGWEASIIYKSEMWHVRGDSKQWKTTLKGNHGNNFVLLNSIQCE